MSQAGTFLPEFYFSSVVLFVFFDCLWLPFGMPVGLCFFLPGLLFLSFFFPSLFPFFSVLSLCSLYSLLFHIIRLPIVTKIRTFFF